MFGTTREIDIWKVSSVFGVYHSGFQSLAWPQQQLISSRPCPTHILLLTDRPSL